MTHIVIVGAGQAGLSLAARLRTLEFSGRITLLGEEPFAPYQRPPLSKAYITGDLLREQLFLRPASFYRDNDIDLRPGQRVDRLDAASRQLLLADGAVMGADLIALATGATPIRLPEAIGGHLAGVHTMRGMADADALAARMVSGRRVLIVGGGYIGLEAAAVAASCGLQVTMVEQAPRILSRVACAQTADWFRDLHRRNGVDLREGVGLTRLTGRDGHVQGAVLTDGTTLAVDFVVTGIGVRPQTELAEVAGLRIANGIWTDDEGRSSASGIFAAGDCCSFPHVGNRIRLESVPHAIDHAEAVAATMLGKGAPYKARPWFWSDQYKTKLQIAGLGTDHDRVVVRPGTRGDGVSHWYYRGDTLLALDAINDAQAFMAGRRMIESGISPPPDRLADPAVPLKSMLALSVAD